MTLPNAPSPAAPGPDLIGQLVGERYRILERIGEGGMGTVYRAEHTLMKKIVAVKLLHPELGRLEEIAKRFEREAQSASRLSHENIIQVTDFGQMPSGALFLVMEYLKGESLAALLLRKKRLVPDRAVAIARQILSGLEHAHSLGVVHRDLKPENIMLIERQTIPPVDIVKILDFGIAKLSEEGGSGGQRLTQAGVIFGTPDYMSPEQAMGEDTDPRSDVYSLGVILYEMLAGRRPFVAESRVEVISMHLTRPPPPFRQSAPDAAIPSSLERVVLRALEKKRDARLPSSTAFLAALDTLRRQTGVDMAAETVAVLSGAGRRSMDAWERLPGRARRGTIIAIGIVALGILVSILFGRGRGPASKPPAPKPVAPAIARSLKLVEDALARGEVVKARAMLLQQLSEHPESARVHFLLGNLAFAEQKYAAGLDNYRDAIKLDASFRGDAALLHNLKPLLDDRKLAPEVLTFLIQQVGKPGCPMIAEVASGEKKADLRHAALEGAAALNCKDEIDRVTSYGLDLEQGKTCDERRQAVERLRKLDDRRAIEPLRKARRRTSSFLGLFGGSNACIRKELDEALKDLGGK